MTWRRYATLMKWLSVFYIGWFVVVVVLMITRFSGGSVFTDVVSIVASPLLFFSCRRQGRQAHLHYLACDREPTSVVDLISRLKMVPVEELP